MFGSTEYRGAITVHDCLSTERGKRIEVTHNAIDRWTGGVIDGGLFTEAVYLGTEWEPITIDIDLRQLLSNIEAEKGEAKSKPKETETKETEPDDQKDSQQREHVYAPYARAAYVLLGLVLAELSAGTLPLGSRSTRGLGQVVVSTIKVRGSSRDGVAIPERKLDGDMALGHPSITAPSTTQGQYDAQRALAGDVLGYLKKVKGATDWSEHLENGPGAARTPSKETGTADD
jgi:CRISPR-associated RAMP protein